MKFPALFRRRATHWKLGASLIMAFALLVATSLGDGLTSRSAIKAHADGIDHTISGIHYTLDFTHPPAVLIGTIAFDVSLPTPTAVSVSFNNILPFYYPCQVQVGGIRWTCDLLTGPLVVLATATELFVHTEDPTTPPTITGSRSPAANTFGWNNTPVSIRFDCTDTSGAGVSSITATGAVSGSSSTSPLILTRSTQGQRI